MNGGEDNGSQVVLLDRGSRSTRGKRMNKLLDEEVEQDELFWNQDALKDEENDDNYVEEPELADEFDSDFDDDEPDMDEEGNNDVDESKEKKKRLIAPGTVNKKKKKKNKKKVISELEGPSQDEKLASTSAEFDGVQDNNDLPEGERVVRKSTRTLVVVRQAERDAIRAALQATTKPVKRKKEGEEKRMTQEEMLLEAAQTEVRNLRNLERVLAREEEVKKKAVVHKAVYSGPQSTYLSTNGYSYLQFQGGLSFQSLLSVLPTPYPEKAVCAVTGLPAKYRDPKTGLPYATKEAFQIIRERWLKDKENVRIEMAKGYLFESLDGKGFLRKKRRSPVSTVNKSSLRTMRFARFGMIPAVEIEDSE